MLKQQLNFAFDQVDKLKFEKESSKKLDAQSKPNTDQLMMIDELKRQNQEQTLQMLDLIDKHKAELDDKESQITAVKINMQELAEYSKAMQISTQQKEVQIKQLEQKLLNQQNDIEYIKFQKEFASIPLR